MNSLQHLIHRLDSLGVTLWDDEGYLGYSAPEGVLTPALLAELREHKDDLLTLLRQGRGAELHQKLQARPHAGTLPAAPAQRGLWFMSQLEGADVAYSMPFVSVLRGPLDAGALSRSISEIVRRHESLRTTFRLQGDDLVQVIHAPAPVEVALDDLSALDPGARDAELERRIDLEVHRKFDVERGPLLRARLLRLSPDHHVLCLVIHHIVCDGWSMGVFARELAALYGAFAASRPSPLPEPAIQYGDFSRWQEERLSGSAGEQHLAYWRKKLADLQPLALSSDRPRPPAGSYRGDHHLVYFDRELARSLRALSREEGVTLYATLLAAFDVLLARYSGQDDVTVMSTTANRKHPATEPLIGYFVNTLVMRCDLSENPTFRALLARVWTSVMEAFEHEDLPFASVVEELRPERKAGYNPFTQVGLSLQSSLGMSLPLPGIEASLWEGLRFRAAKKDLTVLIAEVDAGLEVVVEYNSDLFERRTIERLCAHYEALLREVVRDRDQRIGDLGLLGEEERRLLAESNRTEAPFSSGACIHQLFEAQVDRTPDAVAVVDLCGQAAGGQGASLTYRELDQRANQVAHRLIQLGVGPETLVGLHLERSADLIVGLLGVLKAGGAAAVLDPEHPRKRLSFLLEDTGVPVLLTRVALLSALPETRARVVDLDRGLDGEPAHRPESRVAPGNLAYVLYTSGTTGQPNGALIEHRGLVNSTEAHIRIMEMGPGARFAHVVSFSFDAAIAHLFNTLCAGGALYLAPRDLDFLSSGLVALMEREAITHTLLVPSMLSALPDAELPSLHTLVVGGERCSAELVSRWGRRRRMINAYGPTEVSILATSARCVPDGNPPPIGRPIPNIQAYVVDRWGQLAPPGVVGELYLGGVGVARGYLDRPELTARKFIDNPFGGSGRLYRTGDLVRYRLGDERLPVLEFLGRADTQVKIRGFRVELSEVESVLRASPQVRDAVVTLHEADGAPRRLVAYVTPASPDALDERALTAELRRELHEALPEYLVPQTIVFLRALPLTLNGKVDMRALPPPAAAGADAGPAEPRTDVERKLAEVWCSVLGIEKVGIHDNFFELGGDSIHTILIISQAHELGISLRSDQLFEHQTIAELAAAAGAEAAAAEQGAVSGPVPLTPIQRWFFAQDRPTPSHFNQAVLVEVPCDLDADRVRGALHHLQIHHDALRARFVRRSAEAGQGARWEQEYLASPREVALEVEDLSSLAPGDQRAAIERTAARLQASLDILAGPLMRAALFRLGEGRPGRMFWVIHHLVVDAVSWRVLLSDLGAAYQQLAAGQAVQLPAKTTSFKRWAERSIEHARSAGFEEERAILALDPPAPLPVDRSGGENRRASAAEIRVRLSREETRSLIKDALRPYNLAAQDILLAALARAVARFTGSPDVWIDLEGHGREDLFDDINLSRTVGWFTSLFPVRLRLPACAPAGDEPANLLKAVKEQLRAVPRRGVGYGMLRYLHEDGEKLRWPSPEISFNYLGQMHDAIDSPIELRLALEGVGPMDAEQSPRTHLLQVNGVVAGDHLEFSFEYSRDFHDEATVARLARDFIEATGALVLHCMSPGAGGWTPSDFAFAGLGVEELRGLLERLGETGKSKIEAIYPLAPLQTGMLFHTLHAESDDVYTTQLALTLEGPLNVAALRSAWEQVIRRHSVLRSCFFWEGLREPVRVVLREAALPWDEHDWRALPDREARLTGFGEELAARPIPLDAAPMLRLSLVRTGEQRHVLFWDSHHVLMDGWSLPVLLREVIEEYRSAAQGKPPSARAEGSYEGYLRFLARQDRARSEAFWRRALQGFESPTPLVMERSLPAGERGQGHHAIRLPAELTARLNAAAEAERITLATLFEGAWALLLSRLSGLDDVLFGTVVSGRDAPVPGIETMVGLFIHTLPVRVRIDEDRGVWDWLRSLQLESTAVREHQLTPLVEIQRIAGVPVGSHLFRSVVVSQNYPIDAGVLGGSDLTVSFRSAANPTHYPLVVSAFLGEELQISFDYHAASFDPGSIDRIAGHMEQILRGMVSASSPRLAEISLLTDEERAQVLVAWNQTALEHDRESSIHALFEAQAARTSDAPAVFFDDRVLSYADLNRRANRLARYLQRMGVMAETRVGVCVERSDEMIVSLLAVLKSGGAYVPMDPTYPPARLSLMVEDAGVAMIVTHGDLCDWLADPQVALVEIDRSAGEIAAEDDSDLGDEVPADRLAYIIYTSGSTGQPKGAAIEHRNTVAMLHAALTQYTAEDLAGVSACASICFDYSIMEIFVPLIAGGAVIVAEDALALPQAPARDRVRLFSVVPSAMAALLKAGAVPAGVRAINLAGERLSNELAQRVYELPGIERVYNIYGPTETTTYSTCSLVQKGATDEPTLGRPIANTQVHILDRRLQPVPVGVAGEIYIGGEGVSRGYWNRPDLTAERFLENPFGAGRLYKTGDLGRFRPDGEIEYLGRIDNQVKLRGFRVELGEVESALERLPAVAQAAVVVRGEPPHQHLVAYWIPAIPAHEGAAQADELRAQLAGALPDFMVPEIYVRLEAFPLTASGKVDRRALRAPEDADLRRGDPGELETETERALAALWREVLGVERVGAHDSFFDLGGHSLLALTMVTRVEAEFGRRIPIATLIEAPTLRDLAGWLTEPEPGAARAHPLLIPFQTRGYRPPVFCVGGFGVHASYLRPLAPALGEDRPFYGLQPLDIQAEMPEVDSMERLAARLADIIQEIQPAGPYTLSGHSAGARLALAIGLALEERGQRTALAVLDMHAPVATDETRWDLEVSLKSYVWQLKQMMGDALKLDVEAVAQMPEDDAWTWERIAQILQAEQLLPPGDGVALLRRVIGLKQRVFRLLHDYRPRQRYQGELILLSVADRYTVGRPRVSVEGWREICARPVQTFIVPGDHLSMIREPHVGAVAEHLRRLADENQARL